MAIAAALAVSLFRGRNGRASPARSFSMHRLSTSNAPSIEAQRRFRVPTLRLHEVAYAAAAYRHAGTLSSSTGQAAGSPETRRLAIWRPAVAGLTSGDRPVDITNGPIEGQQQSNAIPGVHRRTSRRSPDSDQVAADRDRAVSDGGLAVGVNVRHTPSPQSRPTRPSPGERGEDRPAVNPSHISPYPVARTTAGPHSFPNQTHDPAQVRDDSAA